MDEPIADLPASTRVDLSHGCQPETRLATPLLRRRRRASDVEPVAVMAIADAVMIEAQASEEQRPVAEALIEAPRFVAEPPDAVPEIVVNHADDIALHLAERLRDVERRELAVAEYETKLHEAEAAARVWVVERDFELTARERMLRFRTEEVDIQTAAVAAAEIAAEEERRTHEAAMAQREAEWHRSVAELAEREDRLHVERSALDQSFEKLRAERRRDEELARSRMQKWQTLLAGDRAQAERGLANLQKHRQSLDQRERALVAREQAAHVAPERVVVKNTSDRPSINDLELSVLRTEATRDHRAALEHRWVAGQLWSRLAGSALATDDELLESLEQVRGQLEVMYRRERDALEDLRKSLADTARRVQTAPRAESARGPARKLVLAS